MGYKLKPLIILLYLKNIHFLEDPIIWVGGYNIKMNLKEIG
jgi:hypothetical protein